MDLAEQMLIQIIEWFDQHPFSRCADGFCASLAACHLLRIDLTSQMRCDAAIDTFLSCFMPLTRLDLVQERAAVFPLHRHRLR
ncbi:MAG: hypothetical protein JSW47_11220 [Phycisphaerales bacterium]|nr:MAG: hypothetical protein JSW47_11220 [Phycisphaerales bacterium]